MVKEDWSKWNGGSETVTFWDFSDPVNITGPLEIQVAGAQSLVFLPKGDGSPADVILIGKASGLIVAYQITGPSMGLKLDPELTAPCGNSQVALR